MLSSAAPENFSYVHRTHKLYETEGCDEHLGMVLRVPIVINIYMHTHTQIFKYEVHKHPQSTSQHYNNFVGINRVKRSTLHGNNWNEIFINAQHKFFGENHTNDFIFDNDEQFS